ncbi:MAG: TatD family hydrolase [Candidatus Thiodiazotropha sp. (ex Monitilora ramsayi)]|nr:TatD family hydrolase [Candidatus Thiodiazotropha sp. (ex Monitilora ramsayi)]
MGIHPRLIDSHVHFDDTSFDTDRAEALQRAQAVGVEAQIIPAIKAEWWPRIRQLCQAGSGLYATYGLHPMYLADHLPEHIESLHTWVEQENPVAIGECGLDFYIDNPQPETQQFYFEQQLELARQSNLPVIIHARRSVEAVINTLRRYAGVTGVLHSYAGSEQQARQLIDMGFYLSFGGPITYERSMRLHKLVQNLPLNFILLETDAPDQPGSTHRGERNEPAYLPEVLDAISRLRDESADFIAAQTSANTRRLFNL